MTRDTRVQIIAVVLLAACLASSTGLALAMTGVAGRAKLAYTDRAEEGQPPEVALGIAMGAFRGIFVNFLWIRANNLKEAGKFFEINDLVQAITTLQPRFSRVWVFHAWNMAYNISVTTQTRAERWEWVQKGVRLLRDKAIPQNPNDLLLHRELAWLFLHKIQGITDDANRYYKTQMASEWQVAVGPPPRIGAEDRPRERAIEVYAKWLQVIADAPGRMEDLYAAQPRTKDLVERLRRELEEDAETLDGARRILERYELHQALERSATKAAIRAQFGPKNELFETTFKDAALTEAWRALVPTLRKRMIIEKYSMDPQQMIRYTRKYGPLDWRNPASHALYWAAQGVERALIRTSAEMVDGRVVIDEGVRKDYDFVNSDRIVIQAVQELFRSGELYFDFLDNAATGGDGYYLTVPNIYFARTYGQIINELVARSPVDDRGKRAYSFYTAGFENFITDVILYLFRSGDKAQAEEYKQFMLTFEGMNLNDPQRSEDWALPLDQFVEKNLTDRQISANVAVGEVVGALQQAYTSGLMAGNGEMFRAAMDYAKLAHGYYMKKQIRTAAANPNAPRTEVMPQDFRLVAGGVFAQFMAGMGVDEARTVYTSAPPELRVFAYDILRATFTDPQNQTLAVGGEPFDTVFPEPPGLEEHRAYLRELQQRDAARSTVTDTK